MGETPVKISALAIIYNEEHNIREYLNNMAFADEIVVVDSYSTDDTPKIIQEEFPHVRFYQREFDDFSTQRNFTIDLAVNDWVLFFDADERVTENGIEEIVSTVNSNPKEVALWVKRIFYYKGRPLINNVFNEDRTARIFRRSKCRYATDKLVHEMLIINGASLVLKHSIKHFSFKDKQDFLNKRLQYSMLKAEELFKKSEKPNLFHYTVRPGFRFFKSYILGLGFLNGQRGFEIARILGYHVYMRYVYLQEMYYQLPNPRILVIQQKMIGDVLASTVICNNLKKMYPECTVEYSIYPFTEPVTENNPNIDKLVLFDPKFRNSRIAFFKFLRNMRKTKYDIVIDAYGKVESNLMVAFCRAPRKISFFKPYTSYIYTDTIKELKEPLTNAGLAIDNRLQLVKMLQPGIVPDYKPRIYMTTDEIESGRRAIEDKGLAGVANLYMISVLGSGHNKTYPAPYMAKILDVIAQKDDVQMIFNYVPLQAAEAQEIYSLCAPQTQQKIRMDIMPGSIRDFLSILYHCKALIGNEGGAINMAKAIDIPTFTIFSTWINKEAWNSFENGSTIVSVHLKDYKPGLYGKYPPKEMKDKAMELYKEFTPDLIIPQLQEYLSKN
ncbi:MAG: glycosyltransferase [Sphingobacteriales bacterium]|nr:MAG: glycosyltransferase [Sphingobacteriales bacterium]